jgi:hypothetical protein
VKRSNTIATFLIASIALFSAGFACNQSGSSTTGSSTPGSSPTAGSTPVSNAPKDITGQYDVSGTNEGGAGNYKGTLEVIKHDDVYQFKWNAGKTYDGVGVQTDDTVAVAFTEGSDGTGCGVVLYKIGSDGSLDGKAGYWGKNDDETEKATRTSGSGPEGEYTVAGKNIAGNEYKGTLSVKAQGSGYSFTWNTGSTLAGFGIRQGDKLAVGIGGKQCGFVSYDVAANGTMNGRWGSVGSTSVGTETAKKK